eukprot:TRINITY_DN781830_c0_g1_i1.p1 TRINITY_DN781830_c0_g1~~TRINITY_DN781830_c0_g1_i1.p1  ORF type:complete len:515 (+),score=159.06 TRINITY_DN781830_c0_g1_i1:158-1702(+)
MLRALTRFSRGFSTTIPLKYVGAIDQGTSSTRFILYDEYFNVVSSHQERVESINPQAGWVSMKPEDVEASVNKCIERCMAKVPQISVKDVVGVGVTNQRETTVIWDRETKRPLADAIVWLDTRTSETASKMIQKLGSQDALQDKCGLPISSYFSALKLRWLYDNMPELANKDIQAGTIDSWVIHQLTGNHVTDVTNASRTMLMDLKTGEWSDDLLQAFDLPREILPEIRSSAENFGTIRSGVLEGVPITGCIGDQQSAMVGQTCLSFGSAKNTYGTGSFMLMNTGPNVVHSKHGLLSTACFQLGKDEPINYALEGSAAIAGVGLKWIVENMRMFDSVEELVALAETVPSTDDLYIVTAFSGLLAPHWDETARGVMMGLTHSTTRAHVARAMLESVTFQVTDIMDSMKEDIKSVGNQVNLPGIRVDGGMTKSHLTMQTQADLLGMDVIKPSNIETTALGAAMVAGVGAGLLKPSQLGSALRKAPKIFTPQMTEEERLHRRARWNEAVKRSKGWLE